MYRLRAFLVGLGKLILAAAILAALYGGWRGFLRWGPAWVNRDNPAPPAMFTFHAKALLKPLGTLAPPEILLPVPQPLSSQDMQLKLMKWRDSKSWLPLALALGEQKKEGLVLNSGQLVLEEVIAVGPAVKQNGVSRCLVKLRVRWQFPDALHELYRVREHVDLKLPKSFLPGQPIEMVCTFQQRGWGWELVKLEPEVNRRTKLPLTREGLSRWFY